jgi:hypothetical protein
MKVRPKSLYYGWVVALVAGGMEFANAASAISILTIFVGPMTQEFGWTRTEIAGATSVGAVLGAGLAPFVVYLAANCLEYVLLQFFPRSRGLPAKPVKVYQRRYEVK